MVIKIKIQLKYNYLMPFALGIVLLLILFIPLVLFDLKSEPLHLKIIWGSLFILSSIFSFIYSGLNNQILTLKGNEITVKNSFYVIKKIRASDIKVVEIVSLPTMSSLVKVMYYEWILLYLKYDTKVKYGGRNSKKSNCLQIINNDKNFSVMQKYLNQYKIKINTN
jgi:membrane-bound ClpP family serine protease